MDLSHLSQEVIDVIKQRLIPYSKLTPLIDDREKVEEALQDFVTSIPAIRTVSDAHEILDDLIETIVRKDGKGSVEFKIKQIGVSLIFQVKVKKGHHAEQCDCLEIPDAVSPFMLLKEIKSRPQGILPDFEDFEFRNSTICRCDHCCRERRSLVRDLRSITNGIHCENH